MWGPYTMRERMLISDTSDIYERVVFKLAQFKV